MDHNPARRAFLFGQSSEPQWAIRSGAEPVDLHLFYRLGDGGKTIDRALEKMGITAGIGGIFNHMYLELMTPANHVAGRIHGIGMGDNWWPAASGRLVGFVVGLRDYTFGQDFLQIHDPHPTKPRHLQHADEPGRTQTLVRGSKNDIFSLYAGLVSATIQINALEPAYSLFGQDGPNSNCFYATLVNGLEKMTKMMGMPITPHKPPGWSIGSDRIIPGVHPHPIIVPTLDSTEFVTSMLIWQANNQLRHIADEALIKPRPPLPGLSELQIP